MHTATQSNTLKHKNTPTNTHTLTHNNTFIIAQTHHQTHTHIHNHNQALLVQAQTSSYTRLLHPQHLDGIWTGQTQYRLPYDTLIEYPEPWS